MTTISWPAWGTTASVQALDPAALPSVRRLVELCLRSGEKVADAQRPRSEISRLSRAAGRAVSVSPLLADLVRAGLDAAELSDGLCDPTVGNLTTAQRMRASRRHGAPVIPVVPVVPVCGASPATARRPAVRGWQEVRVHGRHVQSPGCTRLDLSAPAKAFLAVSTAAYAARYCLTGVLVEIGGAVGSAGPSPVGGWRVTTDGGSFRLPSGTAMATSHGRDLIDPRTGQPVRSPWHSITVLKTDGVAAAALALAGHVIGPDAASWLIDHGVTTARLVDAGGNVVHLGSFAGPTTSTAPAVSAGVAGAAGAGRAEPQQGLELASAS